jgi:hypothetical protein
MMPAGMTPLAILPKEDDKLWPFWTNMPHHSPFSGSVIILLLAFATALADKPAPHRFINLDLPPSQRWNEVAKEFQVPMRLTLDYVHNKSKSGDQSLVFYCCTAP